MGRRAFYAKGALSSRPDARRPGLLWHDSDTDKVYVDDGVEWAEAGGVVAQQSARLLSYNVFIPGTLRPLTIATLANPVGDSSILRYLEANLQSAPVGVDASNHIAARVAGLLSGVQDLPLNSGVQRFAVDYASGVTLGQWYRANFNSVGAGSTNTLIASVTLFEPLVDWTIQALAGHWRTQDSQDTAGYGPGEGVPKRYVVLSEDRSTILASSEWFLHAVNDNEWLAKPLDNEVEVLAGEHVWLGWHCDRPYETAAPFIPDSSGHTGTDVNTAVADPSGNSIYKWDTGGSGSFYDEGEGSSDRHASMRAIGPSPGLTLAGDITLSLVGVGTVPPDPGGDLNLTMRLEV